MLFEHRLLIFCLKDPYLFIRDKLLQRYFGVVLDKFLIKGLSGLCLNKFKEIEVGLLAGVFKSFSSDLVT